MLLRKHLKKAASYTNSKQNIRLGYPTENLAEADFLRLSEGFLNIKREYVALTQIYARTYADTEELDNFQIAELPETSCTMSSYSLFNICTAVCSFQLSFTW